jgi:hypothetical protein
LPAARQKNRAIRYNLFYRFAVKKDFRFYPSRAQGLFAPAAYPSYPPNFLTAKSNTSKKEMLLIFFDLFDFAGIYISLCLV